MVLRRLVVELARFFLVVSAGTPVPMGAALATSLSKGGLLESMRDKNERAFANVRVQSLQAGCQATVLFNERPF